MKRLFIGVFAISIALVSCNKEEVLPVANNNSYENVKKALIESNYNYNGEIGDLYKTENGQLVLEIENSQNTKAAIKYQYKAESIDGVIECTKQGTNCAKATIGGDELLLLKRSENGVK